MDVLLDLFLSLSQRFPDDFCAFLPHFHITGFQFLNLLVLLEESLSKLLILEFQFVDLKLELLDMNILVLIC